MPSDSAVKSWTGELILCSYQKHDSLSFECWAGSRWGGAFKHTGGKLVKFLDFTKSIGKHQQKGVGGETNCQNPNLVTPGFYSSLFYLNTQTGWNTLQCWCKTPRIDSIHGFGVQNWIQHHFIHPWFRRHSHKPLRMYLQGKALKAHVLKTVICQQALHQLQNILASESRITGTQPRACPCYQEPAFYTKSTTCLLALVNSCCIHQYLHFGWINAIDKTPR